MAKWLLVLAVIVIVGGFCLPRLLGWMRLGRLPGDLTVRWGGREVFLPFASTLLLSLLATLLLRFL